MRLDEFLVKNEYFNSRTKAKESVCRGEIFVNGKVIFKPSFSVLDVDRVEVKNIVSTFVSVGGFKLEKALKDFNYNVKDKVAVDLGASTGGFTDCLIQNGIKKVYAVDLNDDLLDFKLKNDKRVKTVIKNARFIEKSDFEDVVDLVVADLSFISITYVLPAVYNLLNEDKECIFLIKPQFENDEKIKFKNGIVADKKYRISACKKIYDFATNLGFCIQDFSTAPIVKGKNIEYLIKLKKSSDKSIDFSSLFVE